MRTLRAVFMAPQLFGNLVPPSFHSIFAVILFSLSRSQVDEFVSWGCCKKEPHTYGLKQQKFTLSQGWRPDVWNLSLNQEGCTFLGGILGTTHPLLLLAPGGLVISWLVATSLQSLLLQSYCLLFYVSNLHCLPSLRMHGIAFRSQGQKYYGPNRSRSY